MIKCGACKGYHSTIGQVRDCSNGSRTTVQTASHTGQLPRMTEPQRTYIVDLSNQRDTNTLAFARGTLTEVLANEEAKNAGKAPVHVVSQLAASVLIDELLECPRVSTNGLWKTQVPAGRYAIELHNKLRFFVVRYTKRGRLIINEQASDALYAKNFTEYRVIVQTILKAGIEAAGQRYGQELGHCYNCGRTLTDEESRAAGIGPVCRTVV